MCTCPILHTRFPIYTDMHLKRFWVHKILEKILIYEGLTPSYFKYVTFQSLLFHSELNNVRVSYV